MISDNDIQYQIRERGVVATGRKKNHRDPCRNGCGTPVLGLGGVIVAAEASSECRHSAVLVPNSVHSAVPRLAPPVFCIITSGFLHLVDTYKEHLCW